YIERKVREATPEEEENEGQDDEWGAAATRGRGYTLYPMVRKFLGTVLVVMVTMIVLSSLGVDIGPLLAGAGVIGLAIGFGAQKLVSDVFSGFFYLLDDAFRRQEVLKPLSQCQLQCLLRCLQEKVLCAFNAFALLTQQRP
ncbi:MAG: mechanosensitive ion channel, partial [Desulfobulbaceae bacterium]|nr:mechanosensitive ion channel [Desulfobulbaceae bacterium]